MTELPRGWKRNPKTGLIDIDDGLNLAGKELTEFPFNFGIINGNFWCHQNKLISLKGGPKEVRGSFNCSDNQLISLEGAPIEVGEYFHCEGNKIISYKFIPSCKNYDEVKMEINEQTQRYLKQLGYKQGTEVYKAMLEELEYDPADEEEFSHAN